jgi:hypothetical protein
VRQAVVIVHGMGEQKPNDTLRGFITAALPPTPKAEDGYHSRPDKITDSYEARRFLAPRYAPGGEEKNAQTEFYEYHWSHMMQGNRLDDMWSTLRRILLQPIWKVPAGLRVVWTLFWAAIVWTIWAFIDGPFSGINLADIGAEALIRTLIGGGIVTFALTYLVTKLLPSWITKSFVDVVRYVDTSPRSYDARRKIRKGMVDLLRGLHESGRYERIVVVAHSLGAYIAHDGIQYLWGQMNKIHGGSPDAVKGAGESPSGLKELEVAASALGSQPTAAAVQSYQDAQRDLWLGMRRHGNPWLITDFISVGTPMYLADQLYTKNRKMFEGLVARTELVTAPPVSDGAKYNNINDTKLWFSWRNGSRRVLYHGAPFAVVRWTNMWFPAVWGFFGDWFAGPLAPLFGTGIKDVKLTGNKPKRLIPGYAHALYFKFPGDTSDDSVTTKLRDTLDLASTDWLAPTVGLPTK